MHYQGLLLSRVDYPGERSGVSLGQSLTLELMLKDDWTGSEGEVLMH